jgi:hypothetical protein
MNKKKMKLLADNSCKTIELTRLQVGDETPQATIVVSTVLEAEKVLPLLKDYQSRGRSVNVSDPHIILLQNSVLTTHRFSTLSPCIRQRSTGWPESQLPLGKRVSLS